MSKEAILDVLLALLIAAVLAGLFVFEFDLWSK